jgi:CRP/FNR family transcriptional regulator, cyclic AMP receptor protein
MARNSGDDLRQLPVFASLPKRALAAAHSMLTAASFSDGTELCSEYAVARQAFILTSGEAVVTRDGEELARIGPGDVVGELALLDGIPRTATVTAVGPIQTLVMSPAEFAGILSLPGVGDEVRRAAAQRQTPPLL